MHLNVVCCNGEPLMIDTLWFCQFIRLVHMPDMQIAFKQLFGWKVYRKSIAKYSQLAVAKQKKGCSSDIRIVDIDSPPTSVHLEGGNQPND